MCWKYSFSITIQILFEQESGWKGDAGCSSGKESYINNRFVGSDGGEGYIGKDNISSYYLMQTIFTSNKIRYIFNKS